MNPYNTLVYFIVAVCSFLSFVVINKVNSGGYSDFKPVSHDLQVRMHSGAHFKRIKKRNYNAFLPLYYHFNRDVSSQLEDARINVGQNNATNANSYHPSGESMERHLFPPTSPFPLYQMKLEMFYHADTYTEQKLYSHLLYHYLLENDQEWLEYETYEILRDF